MEFFQEGQGRSETWVGTWEKLGRSNGSLGGNTAACSLHLQVIFSAEQKKIPVLAHVFYCIP